MLSQHLVTPIFNKTHILILLNFRCVGPALSLSLGLAGPLSAILYCQAGDQSAIM